LKATSEWQALLAAEEISIEVPGKSGRVFDVSLMNSYLVFRPPSPDALILFACNLHSPATARTNCCN